jgi:hypothetical protein
MDNLGTESTRGSDATLPRSARDAGADAAAVLFEETLPFPPPVRRPTPSHVKATPIHVSAAPSHLSATPVRVSAAPSHVSATPVVEPLSLEQLTEAQLAAARAEAVGESAPLQLALTAPHAAESASQQLALAVPHGAEQSLATLRWRGMELSPEFQAYAARVARGEELEPYRGQVLAQPGAPFPWQASEAAHAPLRSKAPRVLMLLLLALCVVVAVTGNVGTREEPALLGSGQAVRAAEFAAFASQSAAPAAPAPAPNPSPALAAPARPVTPVAEHVAPAPKPAAPRAARRQEAPAAAAAAPASGDNTSLLVEKAPF